jgi:hypothetical protein
MYYITQQPAILGQIEISVVPSDTKLMFEQ